MHSFYLQGKVIGDTTSISEARQFHHLRNVLRLGIGDKVAVFDSEGNEYSCIIEQLDKNHAKLRIQSHKPAPIRRLKLTVACAIPKRSKMDEIIDKLTQLGVDTIIPLVTERVITNPAGSEQNRLERWRKIAWSASEQSHRNLLPLVCPISSLEEALAESKQYPLKLVPSLVGERKTLRQVLADYKLSSVFILIGPEGDFTQQEINQAIEFGFIPVSLGDNILRVETAAVAVTSYIKLAFEI